MAAPACMSNDGNAAVFIGTFLEDGSSVTLCRDCLGQFAGAMVASLNGIPPEVLGGILEQLTADEGTTPQPEPNEMAAPPDMGPTPNGTGQIEGQTTVDEMLADAAPTEGLATEFEADGEGGLVPTTANGAPTDEPPPPQPADGDGE